MKKSILTLMLMVAMLPKMANAYEQLADGVYQDGSTLYISSGVTSLGNLQVNPTTIYCYATIPPACVSNTFTGYGAILHVPTEAMVNYFSAQYWYNFNNVIADAIEPQSVSLSHSSAEIELGEQLSLSFSIDPVNATPYKVDWSSTNNSVAIVSEGLIETISLGECDIIATCFDREAICHINVIPHKPVITLDKHDARVLPNHLLCMRATTNPENVDLVVSSNNPSVAVPRIIDGNIQVLGVREGMATITVASLDGTAYSDNCSVTVYTNKGDINCNGFIDISDVTALIDYLLSGNDSNMNPSNADVNNSGNANISDVTALIDYLLSGDWYGTKPQTVTYTVNNVSFSMVVVEGGSFWMGATAEQGNDYNLFELPVHEVSVSTFSIGQTEVTQQLWRAVMGTNPSYYNGYNNLPVEQVSWNDCQRFIAKLKNLTGLNFRLPTEAEWEYAARGGNRSKSFKYSGSDNIEDVAWYNDNSDQKTHTVALKNPNELGLYDMTGNVNEWCSDIFTYYNGDPYGSNWTTSRAIRGGDFNSPAGSCGNASRGASVQGGSHKTFGLRLAL